MSFILVNKRLVSYLNAKETKKNFLENYMQPGLLLGRWVSPPAGKTHFIGWEGCMNIRPRRMYLGKEIGYSVSPLRVDASRGFRGGMYKTSTKVNQR